MPKQSLAYRELSLPLKAPTSPPKRPSSYSRELGRQHRSQQNQTHSSSPGPEGHLSFWDQPIGHNTNTGKDDLLRILRGKDFLLSCYDENKKVVRKPAIKRVGRALIKNMTVSSQNCSLKRTTQVRKSKFSGTRLLTLDRERLQHQKKFLVKNLRMEKWLTQAENRVF